MEIASLAKIKKELNEKSNVELINCCLRMAKFKRDNKELLNYLLFEVNDEEYFKEELKMEMEIQFSEINVSSVYFAKKSIRKILRYISKNIKYSGIKQTEIELLMYFCQKFRALQLPFNDSKVLINLYDRQLLNIQKAMDSIDEDLQFDYQLEFESIKKPL